MRTMEQVPCLIGLEGFDLAQLIDGDLGDLEDLACALRRGKVVFVHARHVVDANSIVVGQHDTLAHSLALALQGRLVPHDLLLRLELGQLHALAETLVHTRLGHFDGSGVDRCGGREGVGERGYRCARGGSGRW